MSRRRIRRGFVGPVVTVALLVGAVGCGQDEDDPAEVAWGRPFTGSSCVPCQFFMTPS